MKETGEEAVWGGRANMAPVLDVFSDGRGTMNGRTAGNGLVGQSSPTKNVEQVSPELILVSPPDVAERARALLPRIVPRDEESRARFWAQERRSDSLPDQPTEPTADSARPATPVPTLRAGIHPVLVTFAVAVAAAVAAVGGFVVGRTKQVGTRADAPGAVATVTQNNSRAAAVPGAGRRDGHVADSPLPVPAESRRSPAPDPAHPASADLPKRPDPTVKPVVKEPLGRLKAPSGSSSSLPAATAAKPAPKSSSRAFIPSRVFAWPPAPRATFYVVRFFRDGQRVLEGKTTQARFVVPSTFRFTSGSYRWYVVAAFGSTAQPRIGTRLVDSTFDVSQAAARAPGP